MSNQYRPVKPEDVFPSVDYKKISELVEEYTEAKKSSVETIDFLLKSLSVSKETVKNEDYYIRNYIFVTSTARKHLLEIEERNKNLKTQINHFNNRESYLCRKLIYFIKKNENAKSEIVNFLCYGLNKYLSEHISPLSDLINRDNSDKMWILGPTYDYNYNSQFYNPDYDFSTYAKFFNTPNASILESFENIDSTILLKKDSLEKYYKKVIDIVDRNNLVENMAERIARNYHFHKRKEIFETMAILFKEEKYTTFILTATIQIEGMFYDLVTIRYGDKENQGTLSEKANKTFSKNSQQKHALYPYFAFDIPGLRNKVAHIGIVDDENIKNTAYELVLDLNCIVSLAEEESLNKFKNVSLIFKKIKDNIDSKDFDSENKCKTAIAEQLFCELYSQSVISDDYFWKLIVKPSDYEEELNYYLPEHKDDNYIYLKDMVLYIHAVLQNEFFWQVVLEHCKKITEIDNKKILDVGVFIQKLKNLFIPILRGTAKGICINVNKELKNKRIIN